MQATCEKGTAMPTFTFQVKTLGGCVLTLEVKELKTMLLNKKEDSNEDRKYLSLEVQSWQRTLCYQMMIRRWSLWDFMVNRMSWWFIQEGSHAVLGQWNAALLDAPDHAGLSAAFPHFASTLSLVFREDDHIHAFQLCHRWHQLRPCHHTRSAMSLLFHVRRAMLTRCSFPSGGAKEGGEPEVNLQGPPLSNMSYCWWTKSAG